MNREAGGFNRLTVTLVYLSVNANVLDLKTTRREDSDDLVIGGFSCSTFSL